MATQRGADEAAYLDQQGMSVRLRRRAKPKPPRGTIPIVSIETADWDGEVQPLIDAHCAILTEIDVLLAEPMYPLLQTALTTGQPLTEDLLALLERLRAARTERIRLEHALGRFWNDAPEIGQAPVVELPLVHPWTRLAMQLLATRHGGAASAHPINVMALDEQREVLRHFAAIFGVDVGQAWALAVVVEVHKAALERQNASVRRRTLSPEQLQRFARGDPPSTERAHAELVLKRTFDAMSTWVVRFDLPSWLDVPLVAYLVGRYAFERGGGPGRKISRPTLLKLLTNPTALAADLVKSPTAASRFATNLAIAEQRAPVMARIAWPK